MKPKSVVCPNKIKLLTSVIALVSRGKWLVLNDFFYLEIFKNPFSQFKISLIAPTLGGGGDLIYIWGGGGLSEVQAAMSELYRLHPTDFHPPEGYVDAANCQEIAGWAWDPKAPDQPIEIEFYAVGEDGSQTLLASTIADLPRQDLSSVLGDNGEHGYHILPSEVLPDGQRYILRAEAVNSVEGLDNRPLIPKEQIIECPELEPEPTEVVRQELIETQDILEEEPTVATSEDGVGGVLPCLGGLLPLVFGVVGLWGRKRRDW